MKLHQSRVIGALIAVTPWLFRLGVATPLGVILVDTYFYTTTPKRVGMDPVVFDQSSDAGYFLDEFTVVKEIGLAAGRFGIAALAAVLALTVSLQLALFVTFLIAAAVSLYSIR